MSGLLLVGTEWRTSILPNPFAINDKSLDTAEKRQISRGGSNAFSTFGRYLRDDFSRSFSRSHFSLFAQRPL